MRGSMAMSDEQSGDETVEEFQDAGLEPVESEVLDEQSSLPTYEILTYPADYTLEVLVDKWTKGQLIVPNFQRKFVWTQVQASKLIESFLLGLPVPPIFLYSEPNTPGLLVVDGQQRLRTITSFFDGNFGEETKGSRRVFRLVGLQDSSPYQGRSYEDLLREDPVAASRLQDSVLRAFVIKQLNPADDTSIYHVFERLNTGGTFLNPQEVRNCVRHGPLNDLLVEMNGNGDWREILGKQEPDKRMRDVELVLRFLALTYDAAGYAKPMKDFLNKFMDAHRSPSTTEADEFRSLFARTSLAIHQALGRRPFHVRAGLNAAVFDSVAVAFAHNLDRVPLDIGGRYREKLLSNGEYLMAVRSATTDAETVEARIRLARTTLFG